MRHKEVTRLEGFSDAVFGFALTLLVVSLETGLTPAEALQLKFAIRSHALSTGLAVVSIAIVYLLPQYPAFSGLIYFMMGPLQGWNGYMAGKANAQLARS